MEIAFSTHRTWLLCCYALRIVNDMYHCVKGCMCCMVIAVCLWNAHPECGHAMPLHTARSNVNHHTATTTRAIQHTYTYPSTIYNRHDLAPSTQYPALVVNATTGDIIYEHKATQIRHPASLVKMMTLYLAFEAMDYGKLNTKRCVHISRQASRQERSSLSLSAGDCVPLMDIIHGVAVKSANDAAWALAEAVSGSVGKFVYSMNRKAQQLGMTQTVFRNPNGLHHPEQVTTARDVARLALALRRDYNHYYKIFKKRAFVFRGRKITGHNHVLDRYYGADGLKTGYTKASGFNLVTSTNRPNGALIGVVMGGPSASARDMYMMKLLDSAYLTLPKSAHSVRRQYRMTSTQGTTHLNPLPVNRNKSKTHGINSHSKIPYTMRAKHRFRDTTHSHRTLKNSTGAFALLGTQTSS